MSKPIYHSYSSYSPLSDLDKAAQSSDPSDPDQLYLKYSLTNPLTEKLLDELLDFLKRTNMRMARLELNLDPQIIQTEKFKLLVTMLNSESMRCLKLNFMGSPTKKEINTGLLESGIADLACYPIVIGQPWPAAVVDPNTEPLDIRFIEKNISKIRQYEQEGPKKPNPCLKDNLDAADLPKIKLKELIFNQALREDDSLVSIEVAVEAEAEAEAQAELEVAEEAEAHSLYYTGNAYNFKQFLKAQYLEFEALLARNNQMVGIDYIDVFAQVPAGIQYITPAATRKIHADYSQMSSFNTDNLPEGMLLQKTPEGALVLDYELGHERNYNAFTPRACHQLLF